MFITQIKVSRIIEMNFIFYESKSHYETQDNKPTSLDVYRGKTTLEITYRDSVDVDSVVVYKMK